ncbi:MAG: hypothetical protein DPW09_27620 [Anaerolineae bacterium]|nr:hypothetical protein [Anaerolineae bacterium]
MRAENLRTEYGNIILTQQTLTAPPDPIEQLRLYRAWVISQYRKLPLIKLDPQPGRSSDGITLGDLYIGLNVKDTPLAVTLEGQPGQANAALAYADRWSRLVVKGDPGSGKSTLLKFLAVYLAQAGLQPDGDWPERLRWPVYPRANQREFLGRDQAEKLLGYAAWRNPALTPVFITLRDFAAATFNPKDPLALWRFFESYLAQQALAEAAPAVFDKLRRGEGIFLFDGVDEVPLGQRPQVWRALAALRDGPLADCRWIATCRVLSYNESEAAPAAPAQVVELARLSKDQIETFVELWYAALQREGEIEPALLPGRAARLRRAATGKLRPLAENPMLLTIMALVDRSQATLPEERVRLYLACVETLLFRWQRHKENVEDELPLELTALGLKPDTLKALLAEIAWQAHQKDRSTGSRAEAAADIPAGLALALAEKHLGSHEKAHLFLNYTEQRAHLLIGRGGQTEWQYTFPHRTFQEYLAARHLLSQADLGEQAGRLAERGDYWRTVLLLAAEELVHNGGPAGPNTLLRELRDILPSAQPAPGDVPGWQRVWRAGEMLAALGPERASASERGQALLKRLQTDLAALLTNGELTPPERAEAGQALALLGDFRPGVNLNPPLPGGEGLGERAWPDILWRSVPAGEFIMGDDEGDEQYGEKPAHRVNLPAFQISQFPITNIQFSAFVKDGGYQNEAYWPEAKKEGYWQTGQFRGRFDNEGRDRPYDFGSPYNLPNHPVVGVSWYEAVAFCRWLSDKLGRLVRLPTEAEWEKAARGPVSEDLSGFENLTGLVGRKYPWGNEEETAARCNMRDTGINATSAVGMFPDGASPGYGVMDMSGNVWEWCSTIWNEEAYPFKVQDEWTEAYLDRTNVHRVLRGGAFSNEAHNVRCAARNWSNPDFRNYNGGFRVVLPPK